MKTEQQYFIAAIDSTTNDILVRSSIYTDKSELERKYPVWCIRMMLEGRGVLECLETIVFEIQETINE